MEKEIGHSRVDYVYNDVMQGNHVSMTPDVVKQMGQLCFDDIAGSSIPQADIVKRCTEQERSSLRNFTTNGYIMAHKWYAEQLQSGRLLPQEQIDLIKKHFNIEREKTRTYKGLVKAIERELHSVVDPGSELYFKWYFFAGFDIALVDINCINATITAHRAQNN